MVKQLGAWLDAAATEEALTAALTKQSAAADAASHAALACALRPFLQSMPAALAAGFLIGKHPAARRAAAMVVGQALHYLFEDEDLLPDGEFGVLGLLDDAYFAHAIAQGLMANFAFVDVAAANYHPPDERTIRLVRALLPAGVADALDRTSADLVRVAATLFAGTPGMPAASSPSPVLRVETAAAALSA